MSLFSVLYKSVCFDVLMNQMGQTHDPHVWTVLCSALISWLNDLCADKSEQLYQNDQYEH